MSSMMKILQIKNMEANELPANPCVNGVVLDVSDVETSNSAQFKDKFYEVIADETAAISVTVYDVEKKSRFIKNMAVMLMNVLVKQNFLAVTSKTEVGMTKAFAVPEEIKEQAPKLNAQMMSLNVALSSPLKTIATVKGKVVKVSPASKKTVDGNPVPFQEIVLKDKDRAATVAVWESMVDTMERGQMVQISKCRVRLFNSEKRLTTTRSSMCEKLSNDVDLNDVSSEEEDLNDEAAASPNVEEGTITAIFDVDPYLACPLARCNNTKLTTALKNDKYIMQCKNCQGNFSASSCNHYIRATIMVDFGSMQKKVAIFKPQIEKLFNARGLGLPVTYDRDELLVQFFDIIPMTVKCNIFNNTIREVICKRIA